ncbi:MAG: Cytochrome c biosis factor, partial [Verrucomicrobiales bacterium]|nr:Cytochrome c biosis factor [Verrucomicrobiales bacterium]
MLTIKKQAHYAYALALAFIWLGSIGCTPPGPKALLQGERLITEGKYSEAVSVLEPARDLLNDKAQYWNHLGLAYHHAGQGNKAILAYQQALKVDRNLAVACFNLGCLYLEEKTPGPAIDILITYVTLKPQDVEGWLRLGEAQLRWALLQQTAPEKIRFLDASRRSFEYAQKLRPSVETVNAIGIVTYFHGKQREAAVSFFNATQLNANYAPAHLNLAIINHQVLNNHRDALQEYNKFLALSPSSSVSQGVRGLVAALNQELNPAPKTNVVITPAVAPTLPPSIVTTTAVVATENTIPRPLTANPQTSQVARVERDLVPRSELPFGGKPGLLAPRPSSVPTVQTNREPLRVTKLPDPPKEVMVPKVVADPVKQTNPPVTLTNSGESKLVAGTNSISPQIPISSDISESDKKPKKTGVLQKLNPATWFTSTTKNKGSNPVQPIRDTPPETNAPSKLVSSNPNITPLPPRAAVVRYPFRTTRIDVGNLKEAQRLFGLATIAQEKENLSEATTLYQQSVKADPSFFEGNYNLGLVLI